MEEILASIRRIISEDQQNRSAEHISPAEETFEHNQAIDQQLDLQTDPSTELSLESSYPGDIGGVDQTHAVEDRRENILRHLKASSEAQGRGAFRQAAEILEAAERELTSFDAPEIEIRGAPGAHPVLQEIKTVPPLVSDETAATIAAQFESLAASRLFGEDGRMDEIITQLLRPMLQEWLEDNLPGIVEKLVRAEIERVARGGRS